MGMILHSIPPCWEAREEGTTQEGIFEEGTAKHLQVGDRNASSRNLVVKWIPSEGRALVRLPDGIEGEIIWQERPSSLPGLLMPSYPTRREGCLGVSPNSKR